MTEIEDSKLIIKGCVVTNIVIFDWKKEHYFTMQDPVSFPSKLNISWFTPRQSERNRSTALTCLSEWVELNARFVAYSIYIVVLIQGTERTPTFRAFCVYVENICFFQYLANVM